MMRRLLHSIVIILISSLAIAKDKQISIVNSDIFKPGPYDFTYGQVDAPIQVLEYFSLTCPHCENFYINSFSKLKKEYIDTGKVFWIKRSYVTDAASFSGTMLLNCVGKENYEAYLNILLIKQSSWAYQRDYMDRLQNIAGLGGISANKFHACMNDQKLEKDIRNISHEGTKMLKISGTPFFLINQEKVDVYSYKSFAKRLDNILLEKSKK